MQKRKKKKKILRKVVIVILCDSKGPASGSQLIDHRLRALFDRCVSFDISSILTRGEQLNACIEGTHYMSTTHRFNTVTIMLQ